LVQHNVLKTQLLSNAFLLNALTQRRPSVVWTTFTFLFY